MLSNLNHNASPQNVYGDETPIFMSNAIDPEGNDILLPVLDAPDFVDFDYRAFSARSVIANGNKLLPSDKINGVSFNNLSYRDRVENFVNNTLNENSHD